MMDGLDTMPWFSAVGTFQSKPGQAALPDLHAWDSARMAWLPTSRDQPDPVRKELLPFLLQQNRTAWQPQVMQNYKLALQSLRTVPDRSLRSGPHDFTQAAIGAALYCVRMASLEMLAGQPDFWLEALAIYRAGHWPCALLADGTLVVY